MSRLALATDLDEVIGRARDLGGVAGPKRTVAIAFFDLVASTARKVDEGHTAGTRAAVVHNEICREFTERFAGTVIKELGDGLLSVFDDPVGACLAAVNARAGVNSAGLATKIGLTMGLIEEIETRLGRDVLGATVDRAARIQALALPGQVLVDKVLVDAAGSMLKDYPAIAVSASADADLKGIGAVTVFELTASDTGFIGTTSHFGLFEDVVVSPVDVRRFPKATDPSTWLLCDICGEPVAADGHDANVVIDEDWDKSIRSVRLVHRDTCDDGSGRWMQLSDLANPIQYLTFITSTLNRLAERKMVLEDSGGYVRVLVGMYRHVFRPSSQTEELDFASDAALREIGI